MKTTNELLHRWAELEPGVCSLDTDSGQAFFWHDGDNSIYIDMLDNPYDKFMLAGFVQQAVEGRGWYCVVKTRFTKDEPHWAYVEEMGTVDSNRPHGQCSNDSPAHALLAAYIQALEAVLFAAGPDVVPDGVSRDEWERLYNAGNGVGFEDAEVA